MGMAIPRELIWSICSECYRVRSVRQTRERCEALTVHGSCDGEIVTMYPDHQDTVNAAYRMGGLQAARDMAQMLYLF